MGKKSKSKPPTEMQDNIAVGIGGSLLGPLQTDPEAIETARGRQLHFEGIVEVGSRFWLYKVSHLHMAELVYAVDVRQWLLQTDQRDYLISTPMPDGNLCYNDLLDATVLLFQKSYPNEEFFSETPSPQNLEDDVPINLED
ncbi:unnamed protein product [Prunus armeniaca]